jgi:plastocyanin
MNILLFLVIVFAGFSFCLSYAEEYHVTIPFGAYDPTFETPATFWYEPPVISIQEGDTVIWTNEDKEGHTVTSGQGSGRFGWMGGSEFGKRTDLFDSGRFMKGESWSFKFDKAGLYTYYCTIHPWMEGAVSVGQVVPQFPHDAKGNKIQFPIIAHTPDNLIELDLTWEPNVIKTHEKTTFIYQTYDPSSNSNLDKMRYDLTVTQNGKIVYQDEGMTGVGGDYRNIIFDEPGPIQITFENIESWGTSAKGGPARAPMTEPWQRTLVFTAIVYDSFEENVPHKEMIQPAKRVELQYQILVLIIALPGAMAIIAVLYMMYGKGRKKGTDSNSEVKSSPL